MRSITKLPNILKTVDLWHIVFLQSLISIKFCFLWYITWPVLMTLNFHRPGVVRNPPLWKSAGGLPYRRWLPSLMTIFTHNISKGNFWAGSKKKKKINSPPLVISVILLTDNCLIFIFNDISYARSRYTIYVTTVSIS